MSVSSPKLTIKRQRSWPTRIMLAAVLGLTGAAAMWGYETGWMKASAGPLTVSFEQLEDYKEQVARLSADRDQLSSTVNAAESQLNMERAAQRQLALQVKSLEAENMRLKEDLAFFESLLPNAIGPHGVSIRRLKIDQVSPDQLRYRLLIMQGGKGDQFFSGNLQLSVSTLRDGNSAMMVFPDPSPAEQQKFVLRFKHYQRVEGVLTLPEGVVARQVQARVLEKGQVRAQLSANL